MRVKSQMKNSKRKAFTLVELLVVIAIIGILFVVLISKVDFATDKAKATGVQTDFRSYQLAIETVARENAGLSVLVDKDAEGEAKYAALEAALNKNLDHKLHVEIDADGKISTKAKDPWKEEYLGAYLAPDEDGTVKDRGAIVMYSKGSNLKLGTDAVITNGVVETTLNDETAGKDDFKIAVVYTYANGYGEIQTTTEGFSNDMKGGNVYADNGGNATPTPTPTPGEGNDPGQGGAQEPVQLEAGLYDANNNLLADWDTLVSTYGMDIEKDYSKLTYNTDTASPYYVLKNNPALSTGVKLKISDSVTKIGQYAFYGHNDLSSLELGSSIAIIGTEALSGCIKLTSIVVDDQNTTYHDEGNCLIETEAKKLIRGCNNSVIPNNDSVTHIGGYAFSYCTGLTGSLVIPDNITHIEQSAFIDCTNLTSITIPAFVVSIEAGAFGNCTGLTSIRIPDFVISIEELTFSGCSGLISVIIGSGVETIEMGAFSQCLNLASITLLATEPPQAGMFVFDSSNPPGTIYVPAESVDAYKNASGWSEYADIIQPIV